MQGPAAGGECTVTSQSWYPIALLCTLGKRIRHRSAEFRYDIERRHTTHVVRGVHMGGGISG